MLADSLAAFAELGRGLPGDRGRGGPPWKPPGSSNRGRGPDDLNPESLWRFRVKGFGPLLVAMDSHGASLYTELKKAAAGRRAAVLAGLGVK